jgi:hypothetical protein
MADVNGVERLALAVLATWWLAAQLYYASGPLHLFAKLRSAARGWLALELECFWCCAFWSALVVTPLALLAPPALLPFAAAGGALILAHGGRVIWREMAEG